MGAVSLTVALACSGGVDGEDTAPGTPAIADSIGRDSEVPVQFEYVESRSGSSHALAETCVLSSALEYALVDGGGRNMLEFEAMSVEGAISDITQSQSFPGYRLRQIERWEIFRVSDPVDVAQFPYDSEHVALGYDGSPGPVARAVVRGNETGYGVVSIQGCHLRG